MVNRHYRFVRWVRATMTAVLVPLLVVTSLPACATLTHRAYMRRAPARAQWSRVEAVPVGTRTDVALFEDEAPPDSRRITGRFRSATADSLTLALDDGMARTLVKSAVQMVHTRRPVWKRSAGWTLFLDVSTVFAVLAHAGAEGGGGIGGAIQAGVIYGLLASVPGFTLQRTQRIYEAPPTPPEQLITQVAVSLTDGAVVPHSEAVVVSVAHASRIGRPPDETIGLTVCLSSRPDRCTGGG